MTMHYIRIYKDMFTAIRSCKYRIVVQRYTPSDSNSYKIIKDEITDIDGDHIMRCTEYTKNTVILGSFNSFDEANNHIKSIRNIPKYFNNYVMKCIRKRDLLTEEYRLNDFNDCLSTYNCCVARFEDEYTLLEYSFIFDSEKGYAVIKPSSNIILKEFNSTKDAEMYRNKLRKAVIA